MYNSSWQHATKIDSNVLKYKCILFNKDSSGFKYILCILFINVFSQRKSNRRSLLIDAYSITPLSLVSLCTPLIGELFFLFFFFFTTFHITFITISHVDQLSTNQTRNKKNMYIYIFHRYINPIEIQYKTCINSNQKSYSNRTSHTLRYIE